MGSVQTPLHHHRMQSLGKLPGLPGAHSRPGQRHASVHIASCLSGEGLQVPSAAAKLRPSLLLTQTPCCSEKTLQDDKCGKTTIVPASERLQ